MNELVIDACSFILWSEVSFMEVIFQKKLFRILLTQEVLEEIKDPISRFFLSKGSELGLIRLVSVEESIKKEISGKYRLGKGELSCIAFCKERRGIFVTDDDTARKKAEKENIEVKSTRDVLKEFVEEKTILEEIIKKFKEHYPERFKNL